MAESDSQKKLFLVEDVAFLRDILFQKLTKAGYDVTAFEGSAGVFAEARIHKPHLILLDIVMPLKNGFDVLDELASDPETGTIPVMILSNLSQESDVKKATEKGAQDFLIKSNYSPSEIVERIKEMVG